MRNVTPVMQRELASFFWSPIAYVVLFLFTSICGILFMAASFEPGQESSLRSLLGHDVQMPLILMFAIPIITMRLFSEEFRIGTIETLMTAPVSETDIVFGKFMGAFLLYIILLASTLVFAIIMGTYGQLDMGMLACNYLGLLLLGALFVAIGLFFSTCTSNQIIAVLCSIVIIAVFTFLANVIASRADGVWKLILQHLSILSHYRDFSRGLLDLNHVIFFVTTTGLFLFLSVKVLETRRWR